MAQYNLIRNGYFSASTTSGTGNLSLDWNQLASLMDGNLTSSGVDLSVSDVLYLDVDLSQRIKIDEVRVYADDLTKSSNIKFLYKNTASDSFSFTTTYSGTYYYTTIPEPSAPRYIRITISGVSLSIYECQVFNDDYIVAFGEDGSEYLKYLDSVPIGSQSSPSAVAVYNNNTDSLTANAYVCVDHTDHPEDYYLEISSSENGTYYSLEDGVLISNNVITEDYYWDMGAYDNTTTYGNNIVVVNTTNIANLAFVDIPMITDSEGFNTGNDSWSYDRVNKKAYMVGLDDDICKLWEFKYLTNEWNYIGEVYPPGASNHDVYAITMTYCNGKIYTMTKVDGSAFVSYTLSGVQDNYQLLADPSWTPTLNPDERDKVALCSDGERYVYALVSKYGSEDTDRDFKRYDTDFDTWTTLSGTYKTESYTGGGSTYFINNVSLAYDYDRDYIYLVMSSEERAYADSHYIQRYNISTEIWINHFIYVQSLFDTDHVVESIDYLNDNIYLSCNPYFGNSGYFAKYNVSNSTFTSCYLGYKHYDPDKGDACVNMLAIDGPSIYSDNDVSDTLIFGQIEGYRDKVLLYNSHAVTSGTYTTPIIELDDKYRSSYFVVDGTATSGTGGSISYDDNVYNGTIKVRSSDTVPMTIEEIFWTTNQGLAINKYNLQSGHYEDYFHYASTIDGTNDIFGLAVNRRNGIVGMLYGSSSYGQRGFVVFVDRISGEELFSTGERAYGDNDYLEFDKDGGVWVTNLSNELYHFDNALTLVNSSTSLDIKDIAVELDGLGIWYIDSVYNVVYHLDYNLSTKDTVVLKEPVAICGTLDNGFWVADDDEQEAYRYDYDGNLVKTITMDRSASFMCHDFNNGFWYISGNYVYHVDNNGNEDVDVYIGDVQRINAGHNGCVANSQTYDKIYYIDKDSNSITHEYTEVDTDTGPAVVFSYNYEDYKEFKNDRNTMPDSADPVWGNDGSLSWKEVRKDGYFLPKNKYHQAKIALHGDATLNNLIMAPAIKIDEIQPQNYKNMYVKTNIPDDLEVEDYSARLKAWWSIRD
jgi:hypothetical protein